MVRECQFTGEFPFARLDLSDPKMPLQVSMEAFNPLIPLNDKDSSLPAAIFLFQLTNPTSEPVEAVLFANLENKVGHPEVGKGVIEFREGESVSGLVEQIQAAFKWKETVEMFNSFAYLLGMFALGTLFVKHGTRLKYYLSLLLVATLLLLFAKSIAVGLVVDQFIYFPVLFVLMHPAKLGMLTSWSFFLMMAILINEVEARIALPQEATT